MKIAFVSQRYGLEVNGGAEYLCRQFAQSLKNERAISEVSVITSCARDHQKWENFYEAGESEMNGVKVIRFPSLFPRLTPVQSSCSFLVQRMNISLAENPWFLAQGPFVPSLLKYLKEKKDYYDAFIFITYLYFPTVYGLPIVKDKAIFLPTAHDEPPIHYKKYKNFFHYPKAMIFLTKEEKELVHKMFDNSHIPSDVIGCGIDLPNEKLKNENVEHEPFILYLGRIENEKNVPELFDGFKAFKEKYADQTFRDKKGKEFKGKDLKLVLAGRKAIPIPQRNDIVSLGFISEEEKEQLLFRCLALMMPSKKESLSIVLLEAWIRETAVMVHEDCEATFGQNKRANGGLSFSNSDDFPLKLSDLLKDHELRKQFGLSGKKYTLENYEWSKINQKILNVIDTIN